MTPLIEELVTAITRQEGMGPEYVNPGNLRQAPWQKNPKIVNGFWVPSCREEGIAGMAHVIALDIARGKTLKELIYIWAPPGDGNETETYLANVKEWAAIPDENAPLWEYL